MKKIKITPCHYTSIKNHALEIDILFQRSWAFVGLLMDLQGHTHIGVNVGKTKLLLQRDSSGTPRAFLNVCTHRNTQLCELGKHSGAVRCPYHGWVFDREGVPVGIPNKKAFPMVVAAPEQYRLSEFTCEAVGQFIFVRLSKEGPSLKKFLAGQYDFLEHASIGMRQVHDEFKQDVDANWKVVIENSLEGYHVPAVHAKTLLQAYEMDASESAAQFFFDGHLHSYLEHSANPKWIERFASVERKIGQWPWRFEHYTHHFIFPNLTVTSFMGYSYHVQSFEPTAVNCTTVHSRTVGVEFINATASGEKTIEHIYADGREFTRKVFEEDGRICKKVQAGLECATRTAILGEGIEDRVRHFQRAYLMQLDEDVDASQTLSID